MPDTDTPIPASQNFTRLKAKLRELFELDKADLDFGIYRVLRQRHTEIAEFLDRHLETTVRSALSSHGDLQGMQIKHDLEKAESAANAAGISAEQSPRVMELRSKLEKGSDLEATADEVYSHLLTFFSRYYQGGDFLGLHRSTVHGQERYMIPYNGEEVKLIWANMDQYYIKSSELLRDYNFKVSKNLGEIFKADPKDVFTVQFKLIEGDTEKDNRKADSKSTRAFSLDTETAFVETDERTLTLQFRYREHPSERSLQDKLNTDTEKTLADNLPPKWKELLFAADPSYQPKDKKDSRTVFQKHLRSYTAKHLFDYFIHKDLGGFLRRELDFYVKNEVMHLDDIEDSTAPKAEEYLSKIRAIRRCALPVIRMVAQLEEFQKKLWLKKKFVVETRYCLTLDRVPEALYADICKSEAQWQEWEELVALAELKPKRTPEFLKANPHLMVDTKHFDGAFTLKLLASIDDLDASLDGVCFHSENFQALQLMQARYREQVKCVYIDPPYNSDAGPITYKNGYRHSSWISLVSDRLGATKALFQEDAIICITIDDNEAYRLQGLCESVLKPYEPLGIVPIKNNPAGRSATIGFSICHEYAFFYGHPELAELNRIEHSDAQKARYKENDELGFFEWTNFRKHGGVNTYRTTRPRQYYPIYVAGNKIRFPNLKWDNSKRDYDVVDHPTPDEEILWPIDGAGRERIWDFGVDTARDYISHFSVRKDSDGKTAIYRKWRLNEDGLLPQTWWDKTAYSAAEYGTNLLTKIFGSAHRFMFPKSVHAVSDSLSVSGMRNLKNGIVLDYFGGSGTTGHAILNLNRVDGGQRKYLLVEMGEYIDTVLIPRLKKVVYSTDWKEGKPQSRNTGISHAFKIVRLESYEDTLNNLRLSRSAQQKTALANATEAQRDAYLLGYFLDVESEGSASLLDVGQFRDPFGYKLHIATSSAGETKETNVDLVETFNWLLGLKVKHIDHQKGFLTVTGERRAGGRCLILWRSLSTDEKADNAALVKYLEKITVSPADTEYDFIYLNGPHTLNDPHNKVHLIEETFHRLMFDTTNFESLS
jgi:adenine-specific DNA-methyltransferase